MWVVVYETALIPRAGERPRLLRHPERGEALDVCERVDHRAGWHGGQLQIPGGGGVAVLEHIRATPHLAKLPVVAVTAQAMAGDRERLLATGFDGYVSKPIDTKTFGEIVESFIGKPSA